MNTIITDSPPVTAFQLCDPTGIKEAQFESDAMRVLTHLYPDWLIFPFRPDVRHGGAVWNPDLAIVDRRNQYWFVVEVEIATHHLEKHVIPQVTAFLHGDYTNSAVVQLSKALNIPEERASTLLAYVPREVVVVSNRRDEVWDQKLAALGIQHLVVSTYRNTLTGQTLHKVDGEIIPLQKSLGFGRVRATDGVVVTLAGTFWRSRSYEIIGPEGVAPWQCSIESRNAWLMKQRGLIEFTDGAVVQFLLRSDNSILVREPYAHTHI